MAMTDNEVLAFYKYLTTAEESDREPNSYVNRVLGQPTSASQAAAAQTRRDIDATGGGYPYLRLLREDIANVKSDFRERQQNVNELMRKRLETQERKQLADIVGQLNPTQEDRNLAEVQLGVAGQAVGMFGDALFRALPFDEQIMSGLSILGEAAAEVPVSGPSMFGLPPSGQQNAPTVGDVASDFMERSPRAAENLGNLANIATAGVAAKTTFRPQDRGRTLTGVSNWINDFYNRDKSEGRKAMFNDLGIDLQGENITPQFNTKIDDVFTQIVRGEKPEEAMVKFFETTSPDEIMGITGKTPYELFEGVVKTSRKQRAGWLYRKLGENYAETKSPHKPGTKAFQQDVEQAARKARGLVNFLGDLSVSTLKSFFDPRAVALYGKEGISPQAQKKINEALDAFDKGDRKAAEKAMGQFIYSGNHIPQQAGRVGDENPVLEQLRDASFVGDSNIPLTEKNFIEQVGKMSTIETQGKKTRKLTTTERELKQAYNFMQAIWARAGTPLGDRAKLVVKRPTGISGNHKQDLVRGHPALKFAQSAMLDIQKTGKPITIKKLYEKLEGLQKKNGFRILNESWEDAQKNGLWVTAGFPGGAVTEGGINGLIKIRPDGKVKAFMSDLHNFGEAIPVVKQYQQATVPNNMFAVSMVDFDLLGNKYAVKGRAKRGLPEEDRPQLKASVGEKPVDETIAALREYASVRPNAVDVAAAAAPRAMLTGAILDEEREQGGR